MFVIRLDGPNDFSAMSINNPTWTQIEAAIRQLDGKENTLVILAAGEMVPHMGIGGGAGRYVVYTTPDNFHFNNLVTASAPLSEVALVAGGQAGTFPAHRCVDLKTTLEAARSYSSNGEHLRSLTWEAS